MLGVSAKDMERFKKWSDIIVSSPSHDDPDYLAEFFIHVYKQKMN